MSSRLGANNSSSTHVQVSDVLVGCDAQATWQKGLEEGWLIRPGDVHVDWGRTTHVQISDVLVGCDERVKVRAFRCFRQPLGVLGGARPL
jgi:hypothetical protein